MLSILGSHCGEGVAPSPAPPSRLYLYNIHPSIYPSFLPAIHPSIHPLFHQPNTQTEKFNQTTNTDQTITFFAPVHDPSITVCVFSKSKQPTSQAGWTNRHTNQRKDNIKERVGSPPTTNKPNKQTFSPNIVHTYFALVARQETNKPSDQSHATLRFSQMLSIFGSHCGEGVTPSPTPPPVFIYTTSIHQSIHPSILPSFLSSTHPSIHPLFHQPNTQTENIAYPSNTVSRKQSWQTNQSTNAQKLYIYPCP